MFLVLGSLVVSLWRESWLPCRLGLTMPRVEEEMSDDTISFELGVRIRGAGMEGTVPKIIVQPILGPTVNIF